MKPNLNNQQDYTADQIQVLEGLEPVRKRPGMYIGSTDINGLNHLVTEIVNNSMDEAIAGFADHIKVEFFEDGSVAVYDNGRGIPYGIKKEYGVSALELAYTKLHAGGKFGGGGYKVSSGLHGVGASVVNALSEWCRVIVRNDSETVIQEYANGGKVIRPVEVLDLKKPQTKVKGVTWNLDLASWPYKKGTIVQFKPDGIIFETTDLKNRFFVNSFREYAFLTAGIKFELIDYRDDTKYTFYFEGGIKSYLRSLNRNKTLLNPTPFYVSKELDGITVEAAFQYNDTYNENILCFANHIKNNEGGSHLTGFKSALTKSINDYARRKAMLKEKDDNFSGEDLREGLTAIISVKLSSDTLQFEGQTKAKLGNSNVKPAVETVVKEALENFLEENPKDAQAIIEKNLLTMRARMAAKAARDTVIRKTALDGGSVLPGKLADCSNKDPEKTEIFIVEGDSAGGCFSGDTLIALADGRNIPFKQIVEEQEKGVNHFCYTIDSDGAVAIERFINARITRRNAEVIKIHLDSKQTITCTPDHLFMLRDGTYKRADLLTKEDSIMPLYRKLSDKLDAGITIDGYEMVWNPQSEKWVFTHLLANQQITTPPIEKVISSVTGPNTSTKPNYNHKINNIELLTQKIDVYDAEVPNTHNFALASGVFVHNSAKAARNRETQAILPIFGKPLNTERARLDKIVDSDKFKYLIMAIGAGIGEHYNPKKLRYNKIILMSDADVDGMHILTLYLTFFFRHMPEILENGHVYAAMPPLFKGTWGKNKKYLFNDVELSAFLKTPEGAKATVQRFKGLGEMNAEELWETTMNPATRYLKQINSEDAAKADEVFTMLMGDEVAPRKRFIMTHAKQALVDM